MTTKEQERKALEQIRKIVAGLGEHSYIATAFEGVLDDAETNIENDWGCSMKQRWESAEKEAEHFRDFAGKLTDELETKEKRLRELEEKALSLDDLGTIKAVLYDGKNKDQETATRAAAEIVNFAEEPTSDSFLQAVNIHRAAIRRAERYEELIQKVLKAM